MRLIKPSSLRLEGGRLEKAPKIEIDETTTTTTRYKYELAAKIKKKYVHGQKKRIIKKIIIKK